MSNNEALNRTHLEQATRLFQSPHLQNLALATAHYYIAQLEGFATVAKHESVRKDVNDGLDHMIRLLTVLQTGLDRFDLAQSHYSYQNLELVYQPRPHVIHLKPTFQELEMRLGRNTSTKRAQPAIFPYAVGLREREDTKSKFGIKILVGQNDCLAYFTPQSGISLNPFVIDRFQPLTQLMPAEAAGIRPASQAIFDRIRGLRIL